MPGRLKNKVAIITGGANGLGKATAQLFSREGASVVVTDILDDLGEEVAQGIRDEGGKAIYQRADALSEQDAQQTVEKAVSEFGKLDILMCNPAIQIEKTIPETTEEEWDRVIDLNLISTFNIARLAAAQMSQNDPDENDERGVIINTASIAAFEGQIGQVAYTAAKAGIAGMSLTMARDLGSLGIRVMAIAPSLFSTGLTAGIPEEMAAPLTQDAAFPRRMGMPEEYARLAQAIYETPMLNGSTIRLDGGQRFAPK